MAISLKKQPQVSAGRGRLLPGAAPPDDDEGLGGGQVGAGDEELEPVVGLELRVQAPHLHITDHGPQGIGREAWGVGQGP